MAQTLLSAAEVDDLVDAYIAGATLVELAERFGCIAARRPRICTVGESLLVREGSNLVKLTRPADCMRRG